MSSRINIPRIKLRKILINLIDTINRPYSKKFAINIMDEDWDYLIIIDACRYDMFSRFVIKDVPFVISGGSTTQEWIEWNFNGKFDDIIYISSNPRFSDFNLIKTFGINPFFKVVKVWDFGWDDKLKTVLPEEITKATLNTIKKYPHKRMIIHFNPPHRPYIGDMEFIEIMNGIRNNPKYAKLNLEGTELWDVIKAGEISLKRVWIAYIRTLKLVMKEVYNLVEYLNGKVVITSDHGNLMGEFMKFSHIPFLRVKHLVKVPWVILKNKRDEDNSKNQLEKEKDKTKEIDVIKESIKSLQNKNIF